MTAVLLIGDAAGLAYKQSGEGIRPAIESGLLAAQAILAAQGRLLAPSAGRLSTALLAGRFGTSGQDWASRAGQHLAVRMDRGFGKDGCSEPAGSCAMW